MRPLALAKRFYFYYYFLYFYITTTGLTNMLAIARYYFLLLLHTYHIETAQMFTSSVNAISDIIYGILTIIGAHEAYINCTVLIVN